MQKENEQGSAKKSSSIPNFSSFFPSLFAASSSEKGGGEGGGGKSAASTSMPNLISVSATAAAPEAEAPCFIGSYGFGEPSSGTGTRLEHESVAVTAVPLLPPRPQVSGFVRFGTELSPVFPRLNNSWGTQPVGSGYQYHCFPYNSMYISGGVPRLKRKFEDIGKSYNSHQMENLFSHVPGRFCQDSVLHGSFLPVQPLFQSPFFPPSARGPPLNYSIFPPHTENQETNVFPTSRSSLNNNSSYGSASVPTQKKKVVRPSFSGTDLSLYENKFAKLECSSRHTSTPLSESSPSEASESVKPFVVPKSSEALCGYHPAASSPRLEDEKEVEGKSLIVLVQKELRNTDVGTLGRIVLPKRDAEANLPYLDAKDGIILQMEDMMYSIQWKFKYRYWPNNKSRMYLVENTGDFVRTHNLQTGDFFIIYKEENSGKYLVRGKRAMRALYVGEAMRPGEDGRAEEDKTIGKSQVCAQQGTLAPGEAGADAKGEHDAFVPENSFDFNRDTGRSSQFILPV